MSLQQQKNLENFSKNDKTTFRQAKTKIYNFGGGQTYIIGFWYKDEMWEIQDEFSASATNRFYIQMKKQSDC